MPPPSPPSLTARRLNRATLARQLLLGRERPTVLVDGRVAGVWRPAPAGAGIEVTAFEKLPTATWSALADEAASLRAFLAGRDPDVYRRYRRWWDAIDGRDVRTLGV